MPHEQEKLTQILELIQKYQSIKKHILGVKSSDNIEIYPNVVVKFGSYDTISVYLKIDESEYLIDILKYGRLVDNLWNILGQDFYLDLNIEYINKI